MTYGETSPGLKTVTLPPVIGKVRAPSWSLAVPVTPGVSLRLVSASTKPWSSVTEVVFPVSESIEATGLGAAWVSEEDEDAEERSCRRCCRRRRRRGWQWR